MKNVYCVYKITFWVIVACFATVIGMVVWQVSIGLNDIPGPWDTIGEGAILIGLLMVPLNAILLAVLAKHVGKSAILWFCGALYFGPLGFVICFLRIVGLMKQSAPITSSASQTA